MPIIEADWTIDRSTKAIQYIGDDHVGSAPSYATVIELHRFLQDKADDALASGDDELDITNTNPSQRSTDNIITLVNGYNIDDTASEHLYDGSIIQSGGDTIYDGIVNFGNAGILIQVVQDGTIITDDWWNYSEGGTHDGAGDASVLTDSTKSWTIDEWVGYFIYNDTDSSFGLITSNTATTITATLQGGTENDWDASDVYKIAKGLNPDANAGISHRFMIKVRDAGSDIDGRRLLGQSRRWGFSYAEFPINGTARGNNVLALSDADDLNNNTAFDTVSGWTTITQATTGYALLDVNDDGVDEEYYVVWDRDIYSINQFFERTKYLSTDGTGETLFGISGELFRGITTEITYSSLTGTFDESNEISWTGTNSGTGQVLADNGTDTVWIQLLTGSAPVNGDSLSQSSPDAASATVSSTVDRSALITTPFVGQSTGSALIGSYGLSLELADLTANDTVFDLTNTARVRPLLVTNTVSGIVSGEDRVLVAPWDGITTDTNGDPAIQKSQLSLNTSLTTANITSVVTSAAIPDDTPASGTIRVTDDNGFERRLIYTSYTGSTFTIDPTASENDIANVADFDTVNATAGNDVYVTYIDELASSSQASFQFQYISDRDLVVVVRDGGITPIIQFISAWSMTSSNQSIAVIRTTDE